MAMKIRIAAMFFVMFASAMGSWGQSTSAATKFDVVLPSMPWALELEGNGFTEKTNEIQRDGRRYFLAENQKTNMVVSVFLEASKGVVNPDECKHSLEEKVKRNTSLSDVPLRGVTFRQSGDLQILEFTLAKVEKLPIEQRNVFVCIPRADAYVDIHISKALFKTADQPEFDALLQSLRFVPRDLAKNAAPAEDSMQLLREGSRYYLARNYREAIPAYKRALEIEKRAPSLEKKYWLVLIDNLSIAYGITGNLEAAKSTLDYGVLKDPTYPIFYYNLACVSAESGNRDEAEKYLKLAYARRENVIAGEQFPDARTDDSFQSLMKQKEFREFVNSLYGLAK
jgi:tetratricopeptide (TPR) repeat protein